MAKSHKAGSVHEALDALMGQIEAKTGTNGYQAAADFEDVTKFTLYKQVDPDNAAEMSFARVVRLSEHFGATAALDLLAERLDCVVIPRTEAASTSILAAMAAAAKEGGEVVAATAVAAADGIDTEAELVEMERQAREAWEAHAALQHAISAKLAAVRGAKPVSLKAVA